MAVTDTLARWGTAVANWMGLPEARHSTIRPLSLQQWVDYFIADGNFYPLRQTLVNGEERMDGGYEGVIHGAYRDSGVVFAVMLARFLLFSEARFQFRQRQRGRPGDLFGNTDLRILEAPWTNGTTGDLLTRMIVSADLAGNSFVVRRRNQLKLPRPDWVTIVLGSPNRYDDPADDLDAELAGYAYHPGGRHSGFDPVFLLPEEVAHFAPIPDPAARYRGMSWLTPIVREIQGDKAALNHKQKYFEQGATPNMLIKTDIKDRMKFDEFVDMIESRHAGGTNAYRTLYLGSGADATLVGNSMKDIDYKVVTGAGETRIAAAGGVPPIIVGLSEGLEAATYSNYGQAKRRYADLTMRPLWRNAAASLSGLVPVPAGAELWYDDRDIPFLAEDAKDRVEAAGIESRTIRTLLDAGFTPDSVIAAVNAGDWSRLVHSGLYSVQLQPPLPDGAEAPAPAAQDAAGRSLARLVAPYLNGRSPVLHGDDT